MAAKRSRRACGWFRTSSDPTQESRAHLEAEMKKPVEKGWWRKIGRQWGASSSPQSELVFRGVHCGWDGPTELSRARWADMFTRWQPWWHGLAHWPLFQNLSGVKEVLQTLGLFMEFFYFSWWIFKCTYVTEIDCLIFISKWTKILEPKVDSRPTF